jgi:hypothetical protein
MLKVKVVAADVCVCACVARAKSGKEKFLAESRECAVFDYFGAFLDD